MQERKLTCLYLFEGFMGTKMRVRFLGTMDSENQDAKESGC
jgi:hypothetical protein